MTEHCLSLTKKNIKVEFEDIGEGYGGDWNPDDPDTSLLRFTVYIDGEQAKDGSYRTLMPVDTPQVILCYALAFLMYEVEDSLEKGDFKQRMEFCSWMEPEDFQKDGEK